MVSSSIRRREVIHAAPHLGFSSICRRRRLPRNIAPVPLFADSTMTAGRFFGFVVVVGRLVVVVGCLVVVVGCLVVVVDRLVVVVDRLVVVVHRLVVVTGDLVVVAACLLRLTEFGISNNI